MPIFRDTSAKLKEKVSLFRRIPDYKKLDDLVGKVESILVVGGGFLGSELAVGMASKGMNIIITQDASGDQFFFLSKVRAED